MRRVVVALGLIVLLVGGARAQSFEPGLVVLSSGDTLRGEVQKRPWDLSPRDVYFRASAAAEGKRYTPQELRLFRLSSGRSFRGGKYPLDKNADVRPGMLVQGLHVEQTETPLFAEVLVESPGAELLRAPQIGAMHYFVRREGGPYLELTERRYLRDNRGSQVVDGNNYAAQLEQFFGDCAAAVSAAQRARFTAESLIDVVQAYNRSCSAGRHPGQEVPELDGLAKLVVVNAGVLGGLNVTSIHLSDLNGGPPLSGLDGLSLDGSPHVLGGAYVDVWQTGRTLALGVHAQGTLSRFGGQGDLPATNATPAGTYEWQGLQARLMAGLRLFVQPGAKKIQAFVGAGVGFGRVLSLHSSLRYGTTETGFLDDRALSLAGVYAEAGVRLGRFTLAVDTQRGEQGNYLDQLGWELRGQPANTSPRIYGGTPTLLNFTLAYQLLGQAK